MSRRNLDRSAHSLNKSLAKNKYSFPKADRFFTRINKPLYCFRYLGAIRIINCPPSGPKGLPPLDLARGVLKERIETSRRLSSITNRASSIDWSRRGVSALDTVET